jgi:class 3 adenylate cyclase
VTFGEIASSATCLRVQFERRLVAILFADLVGFTTFPECRDVDGRREALQYPHHRVDGGIRH